MDISNIPSSCGKLVPFAFRHVLTLPYPLAVSFQYFDRARETKKKKRKKRDTRFLACYLFIYFFWTRIVREDDTIPYNAEDAIYNLYRRFIAFMENLEVQKYFFIL